MEKEIQDNSTTDTKHITGQDPDRYEQGYGSFTEKDFDEKKPDEDTLHKTPGGTVTGTSDKANIKSTLNEDKSTISDTSAPSSPIPGPQEDTNSNAS